MICAHCSTEFSFHRKKKYCSDKCRDDATQLKARIERRANRKGRICKTCGGVIPVERTGNSVYCCARCKNNTPARKSQQKEYNKQAYAKLTDVDRARMAAQQRAKLAADPEYKERQAQSRRRWKRNNRDRVNNQHRIERIRAAKADAHVRCYKAYINRKPLKHQAHVMCWKKWAMSQSAGWWMRHLKATSGKVWNNPRLSEAIRYRIKYRMCTEFRLGEINRNTWRKKILKSRNDGTIDYDALNNERKSCVYCGCRLTEEMKALDHIDPLKLDGENSQSNLVVVCRSCNLRKSATPFVDWVNTLPDDRRRASLMMYKRKKGHEPGQQNLLFEFL